MKVRTVAKLGAAMALASVASTPLWSASHREAPGITKTPQLDNTDFYAFMAFGDDQAATDAEKDTVVFVSHFQPGEDPGSGPNYYPMDPKAVYEIHIDNDGDAVEDLTFQFQFSNVLTPVTRKIGGMDVPIALAIHTAPGATAPDIQHGQTYKVDLITGDRRTGTRAAITDATPGANNTAVFKRPFDNVGPKNIKDYPNFIKSFIRKVNIPGCTAGQGTVFAGQAADSFAVDLGAVFDDVRLVPLQGKIDADYANGDDNGTGKPFLAGAAVQDETGRNQEVRGRKNVGEIAIELPKQCVTGKGNGVIGTWSTVSVRQARLHNPLTGTNNNTTVEGNTTVDGGAWVQVSRMGGPLVNELVIGLPDKDRFNASEPKDDAQFAKYVTNPTYPAIIDELFRPAINAALAEQGKPVAADGNTAPTNFPRNDLVVPFLTGVPTLNQLQTVTPSEMLRLNTNVPATPRTKQCQLGVICGDLAGFPNGRRLTDDVVDIALRVVMGRLCHPIQIGSGAPTVLGLCKPSDAPAGQLPYTDLAPTRPRNPVGDVQTNPADFPYSNPAIPGSAIYQVTTKRPGSATTSVYGGEPQ